MGGASEASWSADCPDGIGLAAAVASCDETARGAAVMRKPPCLGDEACIYISVRTSATSLNGEASEASQHVDEQCYAMSAVFPEGATPSAGRAAWAFSADTGGIVRIMPGWIREGWSPMVA